MTEPFSEVMQVALLRAIQRSDASGVAAALARGADPNWVGDGEITPLLFAIPYEDLPTLRVLMECGADANTSPTGLPHPMALAAKEPSGEMLRLFLEMGASPDPLEPGVKPYTSTALYAGCTDNYRALIEAGANINAEVGPRHSLVGLLINLDQWELTAELLRRGADRGPIVATGRVQQKLDLKAPPPHELA